MNMNLVKEVIYQRFSIQAGYSERETSICFSKVFKCWNYLNVSDLVKYSFLGSVNTLKNEKEDVSIKKDRVKPNFFCLSFFMFPSQVCLSQQAKGYLLSLSKY